MSDHHPWADDDNDNDNDNDKDINMETKSRRLNTHLVPPAPPPASSSGKKKKRVATDGTWDHEIHIWTERERRKKMRSMFSNLHALLPQLPPKADKSSIVEEAVKYIERLQQTLQKLQNKNTTTREAFLADQTSDDIISSASNNLITTTTTTTTTTTAFQTWTSSNLVLNVCGTDAHFCVCSAKKPGLFAAVCYVLDKHQIEVVSAHVSSDFHRTFFMIQAHANGINDEFGATMVAEEIFKQAAGDIMFWLSS